MKLLNQSVKYISGSILVVISLWAVVFYVNMLNEIKESVDEGLENYKRQIIYRVQKDSTLLWRDNFDEGFFAIREIGLEQALPAKDRYIDTMMYMQDADDDIPEPEPVRMLVTVFEHGGHYYELKMINSMVEEDDLIGELLREAFWLYLILVGSIIIINNIVLQRLWKPFYEFLGELKQYRLGSSRKPEVKTSTREFSDLQHAVNTLLQHTTEAFEQQKQFIGNASHELQTPLAIAMNKLELLLEKGNLENAQAESIAEVMGVIERMVLLNKSLLLLTKIENRQFLNHQMVSINEVARQSIYDMEASAAFRNITISFTETAELLVPMDPSLAGIVISNLLRNAVFHNIPNGLVTVEVDGKGINVCNTGKTEKLDAEKIFTRFYKPDNGQAGTGLGLAIVKAICGLYNFRIFYRFVNGQHCVDLNMVAE